MAQLYASGYIPDNSLDAVKIKDGTIQTAKIADSAITNSKITGSAITTAKLADSAITTAKLANSAVTGTKIAASTIPYDKLNRSTSYASGNVGSENSVVITMHDYTFFYNIYSNSDNLKIRPHSSTSNYTARFKLLNLSDYELYSYNVKWRYLTGSKYPLWIILLNDNNEPEHIWAGDDNPLIKKISDNSELESFIDIIQVLDKNDNIIPYKVKIIAPKWDEHVEMKKIIKNIHDLKNNFNHSFFKKGVLYA